MGEGENDFEQFWVFVINDTCIKQICWKTVTHPIPPTLFNKGCFMLNSVEVVSKLNKWGNWTREILKTDTLYR